MEETLVILKPDAYEMGNLGRIITCIELLDLCIEKSYTGFADKLMVEEHYAEHKGKPFYENLCNFMCSGKLMVLVVSGKNTVTVLRNALGKVGENGSKGSGLRGNYGTTITLNAIHASDSIESAQREIKLWFKG